MSLIPKHFLKYQVTRLLFTSTHSRLGRSPRNQSTLSLHRFKSSTTSQKNPKQYQEHPDFAIDKPVTLETSPSTWGKALKAHLERGGNITDVKIPKPSRTDNSSELSTKEDPLTSQGWRRRKEEQHRVLQDQPWRPKKRVARSTMERIRFLQANLPDTFTIPRLAAEFHISFEAVRRILKSKFEPTPAVKDKQEARRSAVRKAYVDSTRLNRKPKKATPVVPKAEIISPCLSQE
ncbi:Required for respiratory growth protein 9 mitochondrial [Dispira simplex]|nr:Required for respiratory growth protein 9 mitochondrial [Dispira simplex]